MDKLELIRKKISKIYPHIQEIEQVFSQKIAQTKVQSVIDPSKYYSLNKSSILPIIALDPQPNDVILDMCASPGGKTFLIANKTENLAYIYANEENKARLTNMQKIMADYGVKVLHYFNLPGQHLYKHTQQKFDKILIDAPCSAEGLINFNDPKSYQHWNPGRNKQFSKLQKGLIDSAYKMLEKENVHIEPAIVYATCTIDPQENEEVIDYALQTYPKLHLVDITKAIETDLNEHIPNLMQGITAWEDKTYLDEVKKCIRVLPTESMRPFFVAKLTFKR